MSQEREEKKTKIRGVNFCFVPGGTLDMKANCSSWIIGLFSITSMDPSKLSKV